MNDADGLKVESSAGRTGGGLLLGTGLVLLAVWLIPLPEKLLDVLWVCVFCLTGAVTLICLAARRSGDLVGFVPLLSGLILLRLIALTGTGRHIIGDEPAGILLSWLGSTLAGGHPLAALLVCLLLVVVCAGAVFSACQRITLSAGHYLSRICLLKRMAVETDLRLGVIEAPQADALTGRITAESRLFFQLRRIALLMRIEAVIAVIVLLACLVFPAADRTVSLPYGTALLSAVAPGVVALSVFTLLPAVVAAVSCARLVRKTSAAPLADESDDAVSPQAKMITVVPLDSDGAEDTELLNPDFLLHRRPDEQIAEFEPQTPPVGGRIAAAATDMTCRNAREYYEKLSGVICSITSRPRVILLASDKVQSLPVTVAVNTAMRLAQEKQRVLLVDTDARRNAVGSVFDLDAEAMRKKIQPSCLENLSVCCVPADKLDPFLRNEKVLAYFATTLIYTPNLQDVRVSPQSSAAKPGAFYFTDGGDEGTGKQAAESNLSFCSWLCLIPSMQSVLDAKP